MLCRSEQLFTDPTDHAVQRLGNVLRCNLAECPLVRWFSAAGMTFACIDRLLLKRERLACLKANHRHEAPYSRL